MKLHFTREAVADLIRLREFIAEKNPQAATGMAVKLRKSIQDLAEFPLMGKAVPQALVPNSIRDMIHGSYVVRYLLQKNTLTILRVWHSKEEERQT